MKKKKILMIFIFILLIALLLFLSTKVFGIIYNKFTCETCDDYYLDFARKK